VSESEKIKLRESLLNHLIRSTKMELNVVQQKAIYEKSIEFKDGHLIPGGGTRNRYKFNAPKNKLSQDFYYKIRINERFVKGSVTKIIPDEIEIDLEDDFGKGIKNILLINDPTWLLESMIERLEGIKNKSVSFNNETVDRLFTIADPIKFTDSKPLDKHFDSVLNEKQLEAIRKTQNYDPTFIWGPPGTGKTTTVARAVIQNYRNGKSTLLVSNTNGAIDVALRAIGKELEFSDPEFHSGKVLRLGTISDPEIRRKYGTYVELEQVVQRLSQPLYEEIGDIKKQIEKLEKSKTEFERLNYVEKQLRILAPQIENLNAEIKNKKIRLDSEEFKLAALSKDLQEFDSLENELANKSSIGRILSGKPTSSNLERKKSASRLEKSKVISFIAGLKKEIDSKSSSLDELNKSKNEFNIEIEEIKKKLKMQSKDDNPIDILKNLENIVLKIRREIDEIPGKILRNCQILLSTTSRVSLDQVNRTFDQVVLDEASMISLPHAYISAGLSSNSTVIAGDFRQLAPICENKEQSVTDWLGKSIFDHQISRNSIKFFEQDNFIALNQQYRMPEEISKCISQIFYPDNPLITEKSSNTLPLLEFPSGLYYLDTTIHKPKNRRNILSNGKEGKSMINDVHVNLIGQLLFSLLSKTSFVNVELESLVGIASPFKAQSEEINRAIRKILKNDELTLSRTIHRFQGDENSIMIIDLTDSPGINNYPSRFLSSANFSDSSPRLLNVGMSRAKQLCIVVGNFDFVTDLYPTNSYMYKLVNYLIDNGKPWPL
jgi:superfamily I DNA and/or RNA helicase